MASVTAAGEEPEPEPELVLPAPNLADEGPAPAAVLAGSGAKGAGAGAQARGVEDLVEGSDAAAAAVDDARRLARVERAATSSPPIPIGPAISILVPFTEPMDVSHPFPLSVGISPRGSPATYPVVASGDPAVS